MERQEKQQEQVYEQMNYPVESGCSEGSHRWSYVKDIDIQEVEDYLEICITCMDCNASASGILYWEYD